MKTLDLINQARESFALEPLTELPKGKPRDDASCPVALALQEIDPSARVNYDVVYFDSASVTLQIAEVWKRDAGVFTVELPLAIRQFIGKFDNGHYPKYEQAV